MHHSYIYFAHWLFGIAAIAFSTLVFSSVHSVTQTPESAKHVFIVSPNEQEQELSAAKTQIKLLENQIQLQREFQSAILDTVYWSLGGVFVAVGLLLGFGWFANFKVYDRDKQALQSDIDTRLRTSATDLSNDIVRRGNQLQAVVDEKLEELPQFIQEMENQIHKKMKHPFRQAYKHTRTRSID